MIQHIRAFCCEHKLVGLRSMDIRFPSSRMDHVRTSVPSAMMQSPSSAQATESVPDSSVEPMEASPGTLICIGTMVTDGFGEDAGKIHQAALAHVYSMRSNSAKGVVADAVTVLEPGSKIYEMSLPPGVLPVFC